MPSGPKRPSRTRPRGRALRVASANSYGRPDSNVVDEKPAAIVFRLQSALDNVLRWPIRPVQGFLLPWNTIAAMSTGSRFAYTARLDPFRQGTWRVSGSHPTKKCHPHGKKHWEQIHSTIRRRNADPRIAPSSRPTDFATVHLKTRCARRLRLLCSRSMRMV